jgi:hypothetical protein
MLAKMTFAARHGETRSQPLTSLAERSPTSSATGLLMTDDGRLRFSLKTLLTAMTLASLMIAAVAAFPGAWATGALIVLFQVVPLVLLFGVIWGERYQRVFCLGALVPAALTLMTLGPGWILEVFDEWGFGTKDAELSDVVTDLVELMTEYHVPHRLTAVLSWTSSILMGLIAVALRRWVFRGGS